MADQASALADIPPRAEANSSAEIRRSHTTPVFKYALTVVDVTSRYKEAEPLTLKNSDEVAQAFQKIYKRAPLKWPQMLQVDPGREFMGAVTKEMEAQNIYPAQAR